MRMARGLNQHPAFHNAEYWLAAINTKISMAGLEPAIQSNKH
jgi:hypothetical protein